MNLFAQKNRPTTLVLVTIVAQLGLMLNFFLGGFNQAFQSAPPAALLTDLNPDLLLPNSAPIAPAGMLAGVSSSLSKVSHVIKKGETIAKIWAQYGASRISSLLAFDAMKRAGFASLRDGEELELTLSADNQIISLKREVEGGKILVLDEDSEDGFKPTVLEPDVKQNRRVVSGTITSSFSQAALELDIPYAVIDDLVDLFSDRVEFRKDLQPGDTFTVVYSERKTATGSELTPGPIEAASIVNEGEMVAAIRHVDQGGTAHYYDAQGSTLGNFFLRYPLQFTRISSVFTTARFHPVLKISRPHNGVDFAAPVGTPVRTIADATVVSAGYSGGNGIMIKLRHDNRFSTAYLHLSKLASGIKPGAHVARGQVIGAVGMTGLATGPHLHFALFDNNRYVDPLSNKLPILLASTNSIPKKSLVSALRLLKREYKSISLAQNQSRKLRA